MERLVVWLLVVPVLWVLSEVVSRHAPRIFKRRPKQEEPTVAGPVKIETARDRYERDLAKLRELTSDEDELRVFGDELRHRFIEESMQSNVR